MRKAEADYGGETEGEAMHLYEVLRRPLITEKYTALQAQGKYAFEVAGEANKPRLNRLWKRHLRSR